MSAEANGKFEESQMRTVQMANATVMRQYVGVSNMLAIKLAKLSNPKLVSFLDMKTMSLEPKK